MLNNLFNFIVTFINCIYCINVFYICYIYSLNTLRLWQPQLFTTIENFNSLNTNITNPSFCEILDISTSVKENRTTTLEEMSNCENVRYIHV